MHLYGRRCKDKPVLQRCSLELREQGCPNIWCWKTKFVTYNGCYENVNHATTKCSANHTVLRTIWWRWLYFHSCIIKMKRKDCCCIQTLSNSLQRVLWQNVCACSSIIHFSSKLESRSGARKQLSWNSRWQICWRMWHSCNKNRVTSWLVMKINDERGGY